MSLVKYSLLIKFVCLTIFDKKLAIEGGLYYKTLRICNILQMDIFCNKLEPYIYDHEHTKFYKHTSLLWNMRITNLYHKTYYGRNLRIP